LYICFLLSQPNAKESRYISLPMTGQHTKRSAPWIIIVLSAVLAGSFFLPWVYWADTSVSGYHMPLGSFFSISEKKSGLGNPFPQFNFATILFWLIPLSAIGLILLTITNKKTALVSVISGWVSAEIIEELGRLLIAYFTRKLSLHEEYDEKNDSYSKYFNGAGFIGVGSGSPGGAIAVYTKEKFREEEKPDKLNYVAYNRYSITREFYSPDYSIAGVKHPASDNRTTLYWNPDVYTDSETRTIRLNFFNNDLSKKFKIVLEGFDAAGKLIHFEKIIGDK